MVSMRDYQRGVERPTEEIDFRETIATLHGVHVVETNVATLLLVLGQYGEAVVLGLPLEFLHILCQGNCLFIIPHIENNNIPQWEHCVQKYERWRFGR